MSSDESPCAWLTSLRADGSPHTTPVWFVLHDEKVWIASATSTVKVRNLLGDPRVSLAIDGSSARPCVLEGTALVHPDVEERGDLISLFSDTYGWDAADPTVDGPRVLIEISVTRSLMGCENLSRRPRT